MADRLVWLKWRLLVNGLRHDRQRSVGFPLVVILVIWVSFWLSDHFSATVLSLSGPARVEYAYWAALVAWLAWTTLPVLLFPLDETLDPARFSLAPITRGNLMVGLTAAALITPTLFVPLVLIITDIKLFGLTAPLAWAGGIMTLLLMIVSGRAFSSLVTRILRGRRGRDLAMLLVGSLGVAGFGLQQILDRTVSRLGLAGAVLAHPLSTVSWLLPPVAAQRVITEAGLGNWPMALVMLAVATVWLLAIGAGWNLLIDRLTTIPEATRSPTVRRNGHGLTRLAGWSIPVLIARKEVRFYLRDPRQRMVWTGAVIFLGVIAASVIVGTATLSLLRSSVWLPLLGPLVVVFVGLPVALNQFGWERNAASFLFALPAKPVQMILGKNLATSLAVLLETIALSLILSAVSAEWRVMWLIPFMAITAVACQLAVGNVVSVVAPLRLPNVGTDMFAQASEQGCLSIGAQVASFFVIVLLMVGPVSAFALVVTFGSALSPWIAIGGSLLWGALVYGIGLLLSTKILARRLPEIVALVQTM
jgi:ABC-2 type transport system permease protein